MGIQQYTHRLIHIHVQKGNRPNAIGKTKQQNKWKIITTTILSDYLLPIFLLLWIHLLRVLFQCLGITIFSTTTSCSSTVFMYVCFYTNKNVQCRLFYYGHSTARVKPGWAQNCLCVYCMHTSTQIDRVVRFVFVALSLGAFISIHMHTTFTGGFMCEEVLICLFLIMLCMYVVVFAESNFFVGFVCTSGIFV